MDEKYRWIIVNAIPEFRYGEDKPFQVFTTFEDITELKNAFDQINKAKEVLEFTVEERTRELKKINNFQKAILDNAPIAILTTDLTGLIQSINPAGELMTGYSADEVIGKMTPLHLHDWNEIQSYYAKKTGNFDLRESDVFHIALEDMINKSMEWHWVNKSGQKYCVKIFLSSMLGPDGIVNGFLGLIMDISKEKEYLDSLQKSEAENRAILQAVPDLMFRINRDGTIIDSHTHYESSLYVPKDYFIGKKLSDVLPPELASESMQFIEKALISGNVEQFEYTLYVNEKNSFFENRIIGISDKEVLSIVRDITYRKETETALKLQSSAFESFSLAIIITDLVGRIQWANSSFSRLTGYSVEEATGKMTGELLKSGKHDKAFYKNFWNTLLDKKVWSGEMINRRKNGSLYYEEQTITPVLDSLGNISNFIAIKIDITNRKKLYQQLADEKRRLADIIKGTNVGTWEWNIQTGEMIFNNHWAQMLGYSLEELSPISIETWMKYAHPDDLIVSEKLLNKHFNGENEYYSFESRMKHRNGEWIWVLDRGKVHEWDSDGKPLLMSGTHLDITESKRTLEFESELLQLSLQLTGIPAVEIAPALDMALCRIGSFLGADRAYIFEINAQEKTMTNTYEWCNTGITSEIENLKDLPCDIFPNWMATLNQQENIIIPSVKDLPESWKAERGILDSQGIRSLLVIPLLLDNLLIGFVGLDSVNSTKEYKESEINILKVWGNMLAGLINYQRKENYIELMRQNYETFFNTIDDFLFVLDKQGNMIHINTTVTRRLGYDTAELLGQTVLMVHPPARRDEAERIVSEMLAGTAEFCPVPLTTKEGDFIPVETRVKHGFWDGKPVIFGVSKDITKIKLSEEKFSKAFQSNSASMAISTLDGRFIEVNDTFVKTLEYSRDEIIGKTSGQLKLFNDKDLGKTLFSKLHENIAIKDVEISARTKSGVWKIGLFSAEIITIGDGRCLLTMLVDISERKLAEIEIIKAKSEAEKANKAKSEFLSRMSHELRTPMNSILGFAQLMEMGELSPKQKKGVTNILNNGKHLLDLINEVLDLAGIESGRLLLIKEPLQLSGIIYEIIDNMQIAANKRKISIEFVDSFENGLFVSADRLRLKQILINLLNNAIKYNNEGGLVTIQTMLVPTDEQTSSMVRISVSDTGNGISPEDIGKLFQPFERIVANKTDIEGTGLGLTVVKKLTEAMNGRVGVESVVGIGSTFWIELSLSEEHQQSIIQSTDSIKQVFDVTKQTGTILLIEDNLSNIELIENILADHRQNLRLITSWYGKQTFDLAKKHKPDLILLDLDLPDIKGIDVLMQLLADEQTKSIPVIIVSADAMPFQVEKLMKAGAKDYLTKPLDVVCFLKTINHYIRN